jgi:WD40 repeat protein
LWDAETRTLIEPTLRHEHEVLCVSFSPDGKKLLTGRGQLWNVATAEMLTDAMPHSGEVYCSAFSPDGTRVVIGGERAAQLWDIQGDTPVMVGEPMLHEKDVRDVAFSPDDRYFATVAIDGKIRLWDARSARAVGPPLQERDEALSSVLVTSDGRLLITGSGEGTVLIRPAIPSLVGTPEQIQVWAELITGQELTSSGGLRRIAADAWRERAAELEKLGGSPLRRPTR